MYTNSMILLVEKFYGLYLLILRIMLMCTYFSYLNDAMYTCLCFYGMIKNPSNEKQNVYGYTSIKYNIGAEIYVNF